MSKRIGVWLIEHRFIAIMIEALITIFFLWQTKKLEIGSKLSDLLPPNHPYIKIHHQYEDQLGDPFKVYLMLKVKEGTVYTKETLEKVRRINQKMDLIPGVNHNQIYSIASRKIKKITVTSDAIFTENLMKEVPLTPEEMAKFRDTVHNAQGVYGCWVSLDEKSVLFAASFISELVDYDVVFKKVRGNHCHRKRWEPYSLCCGGATSEGMG